MKMFWATSVLVLLLHFNGAWGCAERERVSLLQFKASVLDPSNMLSSWHGFNCCDWNGVQCHPRTHHVTTLDLHHYYYDGMLESNKTGDVLSPLFNLEHLQHLDLSSNNFSYVPIPPGLGKLKSLRYLDLSYAGFSGDIPRELGNMSSLHYLYLSSDGSLIMGKMQTWKGNMRELRELMLNGVDMSRVESNELDNALSTIYSLTRLQMSRCDLSGGIPPSLANLTNLNHLDLSHNLFNGSIPSALLSLPRLQYVDLTYNINLGGNVSSILPQHSASLHTLILEVTSVRGSIPNSIANLTALQVLQLSNNMLEGKIPPSIGQLFYLKTLDLSNNRLEDVIPLNISNLSELQDLYLHSNQLSGKFSDSHLHNLTRLEIVDISDNQLTLKFSPTWLPNFSLRKLKLSSCNMESGFPTFLITQYKVIYVDLSNTSLAGEIPYWIWGLPSLRELNLSHNHFAGILPRSLVGSYLIMLDLHNNSLQGQLPFLSDSLIMLDVSQNQLTGPIPPEIGENPILVALFLSGNHLNGSIPPSLLCSLWIVDLSDNNLTGEFPASYVNSSSIQVLNVENNYLKGELPEKFANMPFLQVLKLGGNRLNSYIPSSLEKCKELQILDLKKNKMKGYIPKWIGQLQSLQILILRSNRFEGTIPSEVTTLPLLQILDLSSNKFSGVIPVNISFLQVLKNITVRTDVLEDYFLFLDDMFTTNITYVDKATVINKAREMEYVRSLAQVKCIDLSNNNLSGKLPSNIGLLEGLVTLNVSKNNITGEIPKSLGELIKLESLDLSYNRLFGNIPSELQLLTFLSYLELSNNNLSGSIPQGGQLLTFNESSFLNNSDLCGLQLNTMCCDLHPCTPRIPPGREAYKIDEEEDIWWGVALGMSYAIGFSIVIGILCLTTTWSRKCFHVMDSIIIYLFERFIK